MLYDLPNVIKNKNIKISLYADDIALWLTGETWEQIQILLQEALDDIHVWCQSNYFSISIEKTCLINFNKYFKNSLNLPRLHINQQFIETKNEAKFLGITFDKHLNFKAHCANIINKCEQYINIFRFIAACKWGSNIHSLLKLYRSQTFKL